MTHTSLTPDSLQPFFMSTTLNFFPSQPLFQQPADFPLSNFSTTLPNVHYNTLLSLLLIHYLLFSLLHESTSFIPFSLPSTNPSSPQLPKLSPHYLSSFKPLLTPTLLIMFKILHFFSQSLIPRPTMLPNLVRIPLFPLQSPCVCEALPILLIRYPTSHQLSTSSFPSFV